MSTTVDILFFYQRLYNQLLKIILKPWYMLGPKFHKSRIAVARHNLRLLIIQID